MWIRRSSANSNGELMATHGPGGVDIHIKERSGITARPRVDAPQEKRATRWWGTGVNRGNSKVMSPVEACSNAAVPPPTDSRTHDLFDANLEWAAMIGRSVARKMPPCFDVQDLEQAARIEHWRRVQLFDETAGVPYRAYASRAVRGAALMACRRRAYRESVHDQLDDAASHPHAIDHRLNAEEQMLAREERRNVDGPREYRRRQKLLAAIAALPADEADLVRQVLDGADIEEIDRATPGARKRFTKAVGKLRREIARGSPSPPEAAGPATPDPLPGHILANMQARTCRAATAPTNLSL